MSTLKQRKEEFVSGLLGGSISEINMVTSIALAGYLSWSIINCYTNIFQKSRKWEKPSLLVDFFLNWIGLLLSITLYSSHSTVLGLAILLPSFVVFAISSPQRVVKAPKESGKATTLQQFLPRRSYLTAYRGGMLIITCLAILAVDFKVFPRRFAKVETWGTSLMDLGVGSFVFSLGIVSTRGILAGRFNEVKVSYAAKLLKTLKSTFTVLVLGLLRLFFVKNLEYQEHVTEYGVHWNFFITLVLVGPLSVLLEPLTSLVPHAVLALVISLAYEYCIVGCNGFLSYLLLSERTNLINSNREGIFSLLGYLAIFLSGQSVGFFILPAKHSSWNWLRPLKDRASVTSNTKKSHSVSPLTGLIVWFLIYTSLFQFVSHFHKFTVSRRLANLPYVLWTCSYNTGFLICYYLIEKYFSNTTDDYYDKTPVSLDSINSNGMIIFLLSNVMTGLINLSFNTLDCSIIQSMVILIAYSLVLAVVCGVLYYNKIFIKL